MRSPCCRVLQIALFMLAALADCAQAAKSVDASPLQWQRRSPFGADIADLAYSPRQAGLLLAAGYLSSGGNGGALYRSTDGGASWHSDPQFDGSAVHAIAFGAGGEALIGSQDGLFASASGANRWSARDLAIGTHDTVLDIAIDPARPAVIWAGISDALGRQRKTLLRSADGGRSWVDRTPAMATAMACREIAFDPQAPQRMAAVFAGDLGGGRLWLSGDGGQSWVDRSAAFGNRPLRSVAFARGRVLVGGGQLLGQQHLGLMASDDDGANWYRLHDPQWPTAVVNAIAVAPEDPDLILLATEGDGVHRSEDGGRNWQRDPAASAGHSIRALRFHPENKSEVAAASIGSGVLISNNSGAQFRQQAQGMQAVDARALGIDPGNPQRIALAANGLNEGRVFSSGDGGASWQLEALPATRFNALQYSSDGILYAASAGPSTVAPEGLYRRNDDGSWQTLGPDQGPQFETQVRAIRFSAQSPDLILLAGADYGPVQGYEGVIWRSMDRGAHWQKVHESAGRGEFVDLEIVPVRRGLSTPAAMLAVWEDGSGARQGSVLRSDDGGVSWRPSAAGLPAVLSNGRLCVSLSDPGVVYLGAGLGNWSGRVFRSVDGGISWQARGNEGAWIHDIGCDPEHSDAIYLVRAVAGNQPSLIEYSDDGGNHYAAADSGLPALPSAAQLMIVPEGTGSSLYLATRQGVYRAERKREPGIRP